jgi:hypothetical protein
MIEILPASKSHIPLLAERLLEKERICRMFPLWNIRRFMESNINISDEAWTAFLDGEAACMYGIYRPSMLESRVLPWMMATDTVKKAKVAFYRRAKKYIEEISGCYEILSGAVDGSFSGSIDWLQWLGFRIGDEDNFRSFEMVNKC